MMSYEEVRVREKRDKLVINLLNGLDHPSFPSVMWYITQQAEIAAKQYMDAIYSDCINDGGCNTTMQALKSWLRGYVYGKFGEEI